MGRKRNDNLSMREERILDELSSGKNMTAIAAMMGISRSRLANMMDVIRDKLCASTSYEAIVIYIRKKDANGADKSLDSGGCNILPQTVELVEG